jgi:iron only hydrogenase large subunit-like protein
VHTLRPLRRRVQGNPDRLGHRLRGPGHTHPGLHLHGPRPVRSQCVSCGQCTLVCPTGALTERDETDEVFAALADPDRVVVVQTAPAIRMSLGEALGMKPGSLVTGKMAAALRRLGFDKVFDTQFTADLTIMEEGSELLQRLTRAAPCP